MFAIKSISGQCYYVNQFPQFSAGYKKISMEEFLAWCESRGWTIEDRTVYYK